MTRCINNIPVVLIHYSTALLSHSLYKTNSIIKTHHLYTWKNNSLVRCIKSIIPKTKNNYSHHITVINDDNSGQHCLRSTTSRFAIVECTWTKFGNTAFSVCDPTIWNSLPQALHLTDVLCTAVSTPKDTSNKPRFN